MTSMSLLAGRTVNTRMSTDVLLLSFVSGSADPEGGGGQGVRTPLENHKNIGFLSNTGPDRLKNDIAKQASIQCWAICSDPLTPQQLIKIKKSYQIWTPSDKTFWIRACSQQISLTSKERCKLFNEKGWISHFYHLYVFW